MLDKVQRLYGDRKPSNIIVRMVRSDPYIFSWTNDTLLDNQNCPKDHIAFVKLFSYTLRLILVFAMFRLSRRSDNFSLCDFFYFFS